MRKIAFIFIALVTVFYSCKKGENALPYDTTITGVNLTTIDAMPAGSIGTPDTKTTSDSFSMSIYPNPSITLMNVLVIINNASPVTLNAKLIGVVYKDAPQGTVIENLNMAGQVLLTQSKDLAAAPPPGNTGGIGSMNPGQWVTLSFDVSTLPRGFYRLYIETSDGKQFWDNAWLTR